MDAPAQHRSRTVGEQVICALLWCVWQAVRLPLLVLLTILAPVVRIVLGGFALVGTLTAFLFEFGSTRPFPFFGMLAMSLGAYALLVLYEGLVQFLAGGSAHP